VPPVVNDELAVRKIEQAIVETHGQDAIYHAERSLGGEDFAWYLQEKQSNGEKVLGAMVRMGAAKFADQTQDIHQSDLIIAEELLDYSIPFLVKLSSMQNKLTEN
jgi:amidohydrolase